MNTCKIDESSGIVSPDCRGISKDSSVLVLNATTFALEASNIYSSSVVSFGSLNLHPQVTSDTAESFNITAPPQGKNFGGVPVVKSNGENCGPVVVVIPRLAPSVTVNVLSPAKAYTKVLPVVPLASVWLPFTFMLSDTISFTSMVSPSVKLWASLVVSVTVPEICVAAVMV